MDSLCLRVRSLQHEKVHADPLTRCRSGSKISIRGMVKGAMVHVVDV